jgi:hypothetical protein
MKVCYWALLFMPLVILHHLLNVFVQLANKRGLKKKFCKTPASAHSTCKISSPYCHMTGCDCTWLDWWMDLLDSLPQCVTTLRSSMFMSLVRCLVADSKGWYFPSSRFPNCPRPQLPASSSKSSQQLNPSSSLTNFGKVEIKVKVRLRPTQSACLGVRHPSAAHDQIYITARQLWDCWCGAPSLTRGQVWCLELLLSITSIKSFLGLSPTGLVAYFTASDSRLLQPGGPCPCICIPQE